MKIVISKTAEDLGMQAAAEAAKHMNAAIRSNGRARIVLSTGASQFETMKYLVQEQVDWSKVEMFHLDEYVDLPEVHPASFRKYLKERFIQPTGVSMVHFVEGTQAGIAALTQEIKSAPIDVGLIGIGRNAHIAFNDPPADFDTKESFIVVRLDEECRKQQVAEGWFDGIKDVPEQAISMSVWQIMQCRCIISAVPHGEKAWAVAQTLASPLTPAIPASILKTHEDFQMFVDADAYAEAGQVVALNGTTVLEDHR